MSSWIEQLLQDLEKRVGATPAKALHDKYQAAFQPRYQEDCTTSTAADDIVAMERLSDTAMIEMDFHQETGDPSLSLRLFQWGKSIPLSDMLPIFENMGLRTFNEHSYPVNRQNQAIIISDFSVGCIDSSAVDIKKIKDIFRDLLKNVCASRCENDSFNNLVLRAELTGEEITLLRAYAKYLRQIGFRFSQDYIEQTVVKYASIAKDLVAFFKMKHNPQTVDVFKKEGSTLEKKILQSLESITNLDEDRTMRRFLQLIAATLRTNYFQTFTEKGDNVLSFKFKSGDVPELPLPHPLYEIFIYSPRFEGIHLRAEKVARGGIRWSDRREDFRTEVLGLMKAQKVKNAVIVPSGAKGGFVLKMAPPATDREAFQKEGIACYKQFISALLDLTDNFKESEVIRPPKVVCFDDADPYLVVAADKGTATFSDTANGISKEYGFWLGDAFASGGSAGYDHKKIGITARGAWESVCRHFRELDIDVKDTETKLTVVGIGDMSGDVFGNGMIYTPHMKLLAAFDHRHIFIDPTPDPQKSFRERKRLFELPRSSWEDYQADLISAGGGIFPRSAKSIVISPQMKKILDIQDDALAPNDLVRAILKSPVDLLFNGGIGTYVKSSKESHADVGDKTNEFCRINGSDLRCRVVGEGGNLGFTQLGRVEYALQGGLINTDSIDNSAGVDCSDHEVNIKILLDAIVAKGALTIQQRDTLLASMTEEVAQLVLKDNYDQALTMSFSALSAAHYMGLYQGCLKDLESVGVLDRAVEYLPDDKTILDRRANGKGLCRPELAILLAYRKLHLKSEILKSELPDDPYFFSVLASAFPARLANSYHDEMQSHRLRREIIATQISNHVLNEMGITFIYRIKEETGASVVEIIKAHAIASRIFKADELIHLLDGLGTKISIKLQYELLHYARALLHLSSRWFIRSRFLQQDMSNTIAHFSTQIQKIEGLIPELMSGMTRNQSAVLKKEFLAKGLTVDAAERVMMYRVLYTTLNIVDIATEQSFDLEMTAKIYFDVGTHFNLVWFRDQLGADAREGYWNTLARLTLRDELDQLQKMITMVIMQSTTVTESNVKHVIQDWMKQHSRPVERWTQVLKMLHDNASADYTPFFIALRELYDWVHASAA